MPALSLLPRRALRILLVEDNEVNQTVAKLLLNKRGHEVDVVADGSEAVAAVQRVAYDLVLMDIRMPGMDGVETTRAIRALTGHARDVPIIAVTANAILGERERYLAAGMIDYVTKPIDARHLEDAIDRASRGHQSTNQETG